MSEMTRMDEENADLRREVQRLTRELELSRADVQAVATEITATANDYRRLWEEAKAGRARKNTQDTPARA